MPGCINNDRTLNELIICSDMVLLTYNINIVSGGGAMIGPLLHSSEHFDVKK